METHPNISWKLSNISSMINKETHDFKFNGMIWKMKAKIEKNDENSLKIYLKNIPSNHISKEREMQESENVIDLEVENLNNDINEDNFIKPGKKDIFSFYYRLEYGKNHAQKDFILKNLNIDCNDEILIWKLTAEEWRKYKNDEINFTIFLNLDPIHSTILSYLAENLLDFINHNDISILTAEDIISIIKYLPINENYQKLFLFMIKWGIY